MRSRRECRASVSSPCWVRAHHPTGMSVCSPTGKLPWALLSRIFYWGFIAKARFIKSLVVWLHSISSPLSIPVNQAGSKSYPTLIMWLMFLMISLILKLSRGPPWVTLSELWRTPIPQEFLRALETPCQELRAKTRKILCYSTLCKQVMIFVGYLISESSELSAVNYSCSHKDFGWKAVVIIHRTHRMLYIFQSSFLHYLT